MKTPIVPVASTVLAALLVFVLSGCASSGLDPEAERRARQDEAEFNRQVRAGYIGSGVAPPIGSQSEHRVSTTTTGSATGSIVGGLPSSLMSEIVQGSSTFYRQTGRWPTSREEVELGLKQPAKFLYSALLVLKDKGDHLVVEFTADDGHRGSVTVRMPR